jgi:transcriptional regulator with XRE-family HTH domain
MPASIQLEVKEHAQLKRQIAADVRGVMKRRRTSQAALARRLGIGRAALGRLLGSSAASTSIRFLAKVALGLNLRVSIDPPERPDARQWLNR